MQNTKTEKERSEMESECFSDSFKQAQHRANSETMQYDMRKKHKHPGKGASFIKVLGRDFAKQMQLPEEFTTNMDGYVPHRFIIESSMLKRCWRVEVEKDGDGRMFFRDGWADFVEAHSLEFGNLLLFEYEEQSIFQVKTYNRNGCERTILVDSKEVQHKPQNTTDYEDGEESEAVENEPVIVKCHQQKTRLAPQKYGRGNYKKKHTVPRSYNRTSKVSISQHSSCFSIVIHYSKKHQFTSLTIPKAISLKMKLPNKEKLEFQDVQGKSWTVALSHRRDGRAICSQGWKQLMKDNRVAHRDKLHFEFISDELVRFQVTKPSKTEHHQSNDQAIRNVDCEPDTPSPRRTPIERSVETKLTTKRSKCESESSFSLSWRESSARTYLYMPMSVTRGQNLTNKESIVLRDPEGKCWPLEVKKLSHHRVVLTNGWVEFWKGHGVTAGDLLKFEFVSEYLIQVSIERGEPLLEPNIEDAVIYLENNAIDYRDDAASMEQDAVITQEEFEEAIRHEVVIAREEFTAATTWPEVNNVIN